MAITSNFSPLPKRFTHLCSQLIPLLSLSLLLFFSTSHLIPNSQIQPLSKQTKPKSQLPHCDLTVGKWVFNPNPNRPPLYESTCPFHRNAWNCLKNGRPNMGNINSWVWIPFDCDLPRINPREFLESMRGKRIGFVGDSLNENFLVSFLCVLRSADRGARKWKRKGAWRGGYFPEFDVTVAYHRAVLLAKVQPVEQLNLPDKDGLKGIYKVDVDIPADDWANITNFYDILVFNTGHCNVDLNKKSGLRWLTVLPNFLKVTFLRYLPCDITIYGWIVEEIRLDWKYFWRDLAVAFMNEAVMLCIAKTVYVHLDSGFADCYQMRWGLDKFPKETPLVFYREGKPIIPPLGILDGLQVVLESMIAHIEKEVPKKTIKFWRTQSPRHFYGGEWDHNGSCLFTEPLKQQENIKLRLEQLDSWFDPRYRGVNKDAREINLLIQKALQGSNIRLLNLTRLSEFRADAHPAIWLGKKDAVAKWGQDCMHWCLPGVPDTWVDILSAQIMCNLGAG